ncbi:MAG: thiamine pyrophosphate-dependent enzyme, partial [Spirochaetia bacterium]|nr:thiamine pyrophosphate-dependent enzyme [Spirochaetia bacterium]
VKKNTFAPYTREKQSEEPGTLLREKAVILAAELAEKDCAIVSTTGMISRELYEYRENNGLSHDPDFLTVGSMGHSSQIACGIAASNKGRKIYCFDGDGAVIMHMGSLAVNGISALSNFIHIVFNNAAHDSVGGQMTAAGKIDLCAIARACCYKTVISASDENEIKEAFNTIRKTDGPAFFEIRVKRGARRNLGRPAVSPQTQKNNFIKYLSDDKKEII